MNPAEVAALVLAGKPVEVQLADGPVTLEPADVWVQPKAPAGWSGLADHGTQVALDTRITEALALEGMAREVVRHVQQARKEACLEMEDRIVLDLRTESAQLAKAIDAHRASIASECLVQEWAGKPLADGAYNVEVKVEGQALVIQLAKTES
jgi:isoleucyl-tRNA synthetase